MTAWLLGLRIGRTLALRPILGAALATWLLFPPGRVHADEVAPGLADDAIVDEASDQLRALTAALEPAEQHRVRGIYVAIDRSRTDVLALPACDDDGDYVVVLSRALLDLVANISYASTSDSLRGTHLAAAYADLLAHAQREDVPPLPPPIPSASAPTNASLDEAAQTFVRAVLAWIVAGELHHALGGDLVCPNPTTTHERGDDIWTSREHDDAMRLAAVRMTHLAESDSWASSRLMDRGFDAAPVRAFLDSLVPLEEARPQGGAWSYLTLHPHTRTRADGLEQGVRGRCALLPARCESSPRRGRMR